MNITIKDVAKAANVSVATVSRVLNKKSNVSDEAVQAVNKAVEDLGYSPNFLGRDLRKSETKRILAIIASTEQSFYSEVLRGMQDAAYMQGYDVLIATTRDDPEHEMHLLGMLFSKAVDGAVLLAPKLDSRIILADEFEKYGAATAICTDDGSVGYNGMVTGPLESTLKNTGADIVCACGPMPMLNAIAKICAQYEVPCRVSLEQRMGCGVGACVVCSCMTVRNGQELYARVCKDGPVFRFDQLSELPNEY